MKTALLGLVVIVLFIVLDLIWFQVAGNFFKNEIGSIARLGTDGEWNVLLIPAILVYGLMTIGVLFFVLPHATSLSQALFLGASFGFIGYGLYDLTNLATLSAWTLKFAVVDMVWGTFLCAFVSSCAYSLSRFSFPTQPFRT